MSNTKSEYTPNIRTSSWPHVSVETIAAPKRNALVGGPFGSDLGTKDYVSNGVPVIRGQNMSLGRWVSGDFVFVSQQKAEMLRANLADSGDLVFTQRGTLGQVAIVPDGKFSSYLVSQSQMKLSVDSNTADPMFMYYQFSSGKVQQYIKNHTISAGVPHINLSILRNLPVYLPPLTVQRQIADVLGALDDKIELNRRMNETLEAMARALFQSWFVDFDPVRVKARGGDPVAELGIAPEIAALFPDSLVVTEFGPVPAGWKLSNIGSEFTLTMGQAPASSTYNTSGAGFPLFQGKTDFGSRYPNNRIYCTAASRFAQPKDTLVTVRAPVGSINLAFEKCAIGRGVAAIRHSSGVSSFTYYSMDALSPEFARFNEEGTIFGAINKEAFKGIIFIAAPYSLLEVFEGVVKDWDSLIVTNDDMNTTLNATINYLLPKLLSGEIQPNRWQL